MEKINSGLEIIRKAQSTISGKTVVLTRKTNKAGQIRHGVVLESASGRHTRIGTFEGVSDAFRLYKSLVKA